MSRTFSQLETEINNSTGDSPATATIREITNTALRQLWFDLDLRSAKRRVALSPNLFNDIFDYAVPSDIKGNKVIDLKPQINRGQYDKWLLKTPEKFDLLKDVAGQRIITVDHRDFVNKIRVSLGIDDEEIVIDDMDAVTGWSLFGDGENVTLDDVNFVKGKGSVNWDISSAGGTTAGIQKSTITSFDISKYLTEGVIFARVYITSVTDITNFIIRLGSSSSAYYHITVTTAHDGNAFQAGWNVLRFQMVDKSTTGSPTNAATTFAALYMTKDGGKVSETDYRFDHLVIKIGDYYNLFYYTRFPWRTSADVYLENSTANDDKTNTETDEDNLVLLKCMEFEHRRLRNFRMVREFRELYDIAKDKYESDYPSEALKDEIIAELPRASERGNDGYDY